jgi:hypothetical protein
VLVGNVARPVWTETPNMPLQRTHSRASLGRSPLNGGPLGVGSPGQLCRLVQPRMKEEAV